MSAEDQAAQKRSQQLDRQMRQAMNKDSEVVKLLLLGAGESGKRYVRWKLPRGLLVRCPGSLPALLDRGADPLYNFATM